jgi:putative cardiolipin synthase
VVDTPPVQSGFVSLHAKVMVIDRQRVLIGSANLDARSLKHNTEMGMVIDCAPLAEELATLIERAIQPGNAWRVVVDKDGEVMWSAGKELRREAPAREGSQRAEELIHRLFPADMY